MYFAIKQKDDNIETIEEIHRFFNYAGNIYRNKDNSASANSGITKPTAYYRITKTSDLMVIIDHFDKYPLQSKKKRDIYSIWRKMVIHKLENYRNINYGLLSNLADRLSSINSQNRLVKESVG